jgi:hypothetical protein
MTMQKGHETAEARFRRPRSPHAGLVDARAELLLHPHPAAARAAAEARSREPRQLLELRPGIASRIDAARRNRRCSAEVARVVERDRLSIGSSSGRALGDQLATSCGRARLVVPAEAPVLVLMQLKQCGQFVTIFFTP